MTSGRLDEEAVVASVVPMVRLPHGLPDQLEDLGPAHHVLRGPIGGSVIQCHDPVQLGNHIGEVTGQEAHLVAEGEQRQQAGGPTARRHSR